MAARARVVIVGAGFGGLTAARALRRQPVDVLLVDRHNYHLFTPLLYQVASALLSPVEIARPVRAMIRPLRNADFLLASVEGVDLDGRRLRTDRGPVEYDYLVLAAGSANNYFGNHELEESSLNLKDLPSALGLRNHVLDVFEKARWEPDAERRRQLLAFAVVGGGPTGVEYAGALAELVQLVLRRDYPDLDLSDFRIHLLEGSDRLLAPFAPGLQHSAERALRAKGVEVVYKALVKSIAPGRVELADGRVVEAGNVVWAAGVRADDLAASIDRPKGGHGRVQVEPTLQLAGRPEVFAIGDMASLRQDGEELPMLIPVAMQQAKSAAASIGALVRGGQARPFRYSDPGIMATIGRNQGVAQIHGVKLSGFLGWLMWLAVHLVNVLSFRNRLVVLIDWAWEYFLYDRPVRLILRAAPATPSVPSSAAEEAGAGPGPAPARRARRASSSRSR